MIKARVTIAPILRHRPTRVLFLSSLLKRFKTFEGLLEFGEVYTEHGQTQTNLASADVVDKWDVWLLILMVFAG